MTPSRSDEFLIARLLPLTVSERARALEQAHAEDSTLRDRLQQIMAALAAAENSPQADSGRRLSPTSARLFLKSGLEVEPDEMPGSRMGNYRLLQEIGLGGFGVVWMADQEGPIRRRVALKIIKTGMDTKEVIARFEAERQALALMDHPNIARVFDAGATETGRPYFVMELVRGVAITRYCDENKLDANARLHLFISVCQAVQHAHQKGVIHRDLKPSNILVTLHDGVPIPKVIDFGIAKATSGARLTDKTLFTQFHSFIGTPAHTSPEQMEMSGLDVDTRSDIYSLGVLLYELLTGRPPFDADVLLKSGLEAMRRTIREIDPPRPSHRLTTLTDAERTSVVQQRSTDAGKLSLLLRGDLDWIVMRCLEKDRTRRYETANGLARDIERHLKSEPVVARPPSSAYRVRKFIGRHRLAFFATAAVTVSIIAGLIVSSVSLVRERTAHRRAAAAEQAEGQLRQRAESARIEEVKRSARTALDLANRNLADGRIADGLGYLVYAARKDPLSRTIAPRLASVLTSHDFILPERAPFECGSRVIATRYSLDGRTFFIGTVDGTLRVFDSANGKLIRQFALGKPVNLFGGWQFASATDEVFAARFEDNSLAVFDATTGRPLAAPIPLDSSVRSDPETIDHVGLSPDGRWAYASGRSFWLWDTVTGENRIEFSNGGNIINPVFGSDNRRLIVVAGDSARIWSLPDCSLLENPTGPEAESRRIRHSYNDTGPASTVHLVSAKVSRDGKRFAVLQSGIGVDLFDSTTGARLAPQIPIDDAFPTPYWGFTPDGRLLIAAWPTIQLWDLDKHTFTALPAADTRSIDFNRDGTRLLTISNGATRLWNMTTGSLTAELTASREQFGLHGALSPDGAQIVVGTAEGSVKRLRVSRNTARPLVLSNAQSLISATFFPDGGARLLLVGTNRLRVLDLGSARELPAGFLLPHAIAANGNPVYLRGSYRPPIREDLKFLVVWNGPSRWEAWELDGRGVRSVVPLRESPTENGMVIFSPAGDRVAIANAQWSKWPTTIRVWDLRTGECVGPTIDCGKAIVAIAVRFSPDGRRLGIGCENGLASVWDISTGRQLVRFQPLQDVPVLDVRFSPDGTRVVTADKAGEVRLWDSATGVPLSPVIHHGDEWPRVTFAHDGRYFVTLSDFDVRFWDGRTADPIRNSIETLDNGGLCISPDDRRLLTVSYPGDARVWDVRTRQPLSEPMHHPLALAGGNFSPDSRFMLTDTFDRTYYAWSVPPSQPDGTATPEWLLQLATVCATKTVNDAGELVDAAELMAQLDEVRHQLATLPEDAPLADWGRWILNDHADRSIAPGFTITPAEAEALKIKLDATTEQ